MFLEMIPATEWLTVGLLVFAGTQVWLQARQERHRRLERKRDCDELADRAFHYAWAEHFRLEGLADRLRTDDLIEMVVLGVLRPTDVLPHDWGELTRCLASLGRESGFLGGVAAALCHDVERAILIFSGSVKAFAKRAPDQLGDGERVLWIRDQFAKDLEPWEDSIREQVQELSFLMWDAVNQSERAKVERELDFTDDMKSQFARATIKSLKERSTGDGSHLLPDTSSPTALPESS